MGIEKHHVTGVQYYLDNLMQFADENYAYTLSKKEMIDENFIDEREYQYCFYPKEIKLEPEPDNPHDPKAIKVLFDDLLVGYIKKGSCAHILKLINLNKIVKIDADIYGGKYKKIIEEDYDSYTLEKDETNYGITLIVHVVDDAEENENFSSSISESKLKLKDDTSSITNPKNTTPTINYIPASQSNIKPNIINTTPQPLSPEQKKGCWCCLISIIIFIFLLIVIF